MNNDYNSSVETAFSEIKYEINKAKEKHGDNNFNSRHEAYAVILEEVDELWEEFKKNTKNFDPLLARKEAVQVGAMIVRCMVEIL